MGKDIKKKEVERKKRKAISNVRKQSVFHRHLLPSPLHPQGEGVERFKLHQVVSNAAGGSCSIAPCPVPDAAGDTAQLSPSPLPPPDAGTSSAVTDTAIIDCRLQRLALASPQLSSHLFSSVQQSASLQRQLLEKAQIDRVSRYPLPSAFNVPLQGGAGRAPAPARGAQLVPKEREE